MESEKLLLDLTTEIVYQTGIITKTHSTQFVVELNHIVRKIMYTFNSIKLILCTQPKKK